MLNSDQCLGRRCRAAVWAATAILTLVAAVLAPQSARALDIEFSGRAVKRDIIAIFDSKAEKSARHSRIHRFVEMPLNHLGYRLTYFDVNKPLPPISELGHYRGIVSWLIEPMDHPTRYLEWLDAATAAGLRLAFITELVQPEPRTHVPHKRRILERLGLEPTVHYITDTRALKITQINKAMIEFERPLDTVFPDFAALKPIPGRTTVQLGVTVPAKGTEVSAALVTTNAAGGYIGDELSVFFEPNSGRLRWIVNPFLFFKLALGEDRFPIPDTTTLAGRRIYFSHIDGDGWNNLSEIDQFRAQRLTSAEVIGRHAIEAYPDLPVSVGLIAGDIDPELGGRPENASTARRLFALPHVEVASHTYTHPFNWGFFENYSREAEEALIDKAVRPAVPVVARLSQAVSSLAGRTSTSTLTNRYIAGSDDLPRSYMAKPFDLDKEIAGALKVAESLAPPGKRAKLYMWSGNTSPFEGAIAATRRAGVRNINGGDSRFDKEFPSVLYVPPISRPVGKERQIYAVNSNENTYTNNWTGPYYGFFLLEQTLDNTERPRRLKPFNLYYHMYSGEKPAAFASILHFLELARKSPVIPIDTSHYAAIADDFFSVEVRQTDLFAWSVEKRGALQTVRFDDAGGIEIDEDRSRGVLGSTRKDGSLYVALDEKVERAVIAIRPVGGTQNQGGDARKVPLSLVSSRWNIFGRDERSCGYSFQARGYGAGDMEWRTTPGRSFRVTVVGAKGPINASTVAADAQGRLTFSLPPTHGQTVDLRIECHG